MTMGDFFEKLSFLIIFPYQNTIAGKKDVLNCTENAKQNIELVWLTFRNSPTT